MIPTATNPLTNRPYSQRYYTILEARKKLPVWEQRNEFFDVLAKNQTIVLVGETGSGKTTQIPSLMLEAGVARQRRMVACTQPRRVAAMSVSKRVSEELDVELGEEVGYNIRFGWLLRGSKRRGGRRELTGSGSTLAPNRGHDRS
jgi:pre-mRNA-splicing factor ATP-dependent RNA helicase DHX15/PRP43